MNAEQPIRSPLDHPIRLAVLISGGGTTLQNLIDHIRDGRLAAEIRLVVADKAHCAGIERARNADLPCEIVPRRNYSTVDEFSTAVFALCRRAAVDAVVLGGFLSLLRIPDDFHHRVLNIHPALVPAFCGRGFHGNRVHAEVLERGVKISGCTVHFADNEYDHGPIILQRAVPVLDDDTPETLQARVFQAECEAYPEAIRLYAAARLEILNGRVRIAPEHTAR